MKGHFLPRKSKFVFLNNSIETCHAGVVHYLGHQPFSICSRIRTPAGASRTAQEIARPPHLDTQRFGLPPAGQFIVEDRLRYKNGRKDVCNQTNRQGYRKSLHRTFPEEKEEAAGYH